MLNIALPSTTLFIIALLINRQLKRNPQSKGDLEIPLEQMLKNLRENGQHSHSFLTLYPGFNYFSSKKPTLSGTIAYLDLSRSWVAAVEPVASIENRSLLLAEFAEAAAALEKTVIFLPVSSQVAAQAVDVGYAAIFVGEEAYFDFNDYPKTGSTWVDVVPTAKQMDMRGAQVREFSPTTSSDELKAELDLILREWFASRKMAPLGFLNAVNPWFLSLHKRYFYIELSGRILAFLAAVPVWPKKGWHINDYIRRKNTPAGATELLILKAMKLLHDQGAEEVSLGISPLSGLENAESIPLADVKSHPRLYRFFRFLIQRADIFYGFKSLSQYKKKFSPTRSEPVFLIYRNGRKEKQGLGFLNVLNILQVFLQNGFVYATQSGIVRSLKKISIDKLIKSQLKSNVVARSAPRNWSKLFWRCKFTLVLVVINVGLYFITTESSGILFPSIESHWGYSWYGFQRSPLHALALSPFLHWNQSHLNLNLVTLVFFTGGLEYLAGTRIALMSYVIPMLLSNPLTSLFLLPLSYFDPNEIDIGASLGIFGTAGALVGFLKHGPLILGGLLVVTLLQAIMTHHLLVLNHWFAILLGIVLGKFLLRT